MSGPDGPRRLPWYAEGIRFECQQSGKCCTNHGDYAYVYLHGEDEARLIEHFGLPRPDFRRRYTRIVEGWRVLRSKDEGCIFLEGKSCGVYAARPEQCRTWPFWRATLDEQVWKREVAPFCAGVGKGRVWTREEIEAFARRSAEDEEAEE